VKETDIYICNIILQKCGWRENITLTMFEPHLALSLLEKDNFKQKLRRMKSDFMFITFFFPPFCMLHCFWGNCEGCYFQTCTL